MSCLIRLSHDYLREVRNLLSVQFFLAALSSYSKEPLNDAVSTAPVHVKGCVTVAWQGGERHEKGGEERVRPVDCSEQLLQ